MLYTPGTRHGTHGLIHKANLHHTPSSGRDHASGRDASGRDARSLHTTSLYKESCEPVLMCFPRTPDLKTQRIPERPKPSQSPSHAFKRARCERARCERARCERARCERGAMRAGAMPDHYTRNQVCPTAPQALVIHTPCPVEAHRARTNSTTQSGQVWDKVWLWARCKRARCEQARCEPQSQTNPSANHHAVIQGVT